MTKKEIKGYIDSINGKSIGLAAAMNDANSRDGRENYAIAKTRLYDSVKLFCAAAGIVKDNNVIDPVDIIIDGVNMRAVRYTKGDFKALSGSGFRKWFKEFIVEKFGISLESDSTIETKTTRKTKADLQAEIDALKAQLAAK